jgi:hypothetical protein
MLGERQSWRTVSYFFSDVFDVTFNVGVDRRSRTGLWGSVKTVVLRPTPITKAAGHFSTSRGSQAAGALINRSDISATKVNCRTPASR